MSRRGVFLGRLGASPPALLNRAHRFPTPLVLQNTSEVKQVQERPQSSLSLTASSEHVVCAREASLWWWPAACPALPPRPSLPPCFGEERNAGIWRAAKGLQSFRELLPACSAAVLHGSVPGDPLQSLRGASAVLVPPQAWAWASLPVGVSISAVGILWR